MPDPFGLEEIDAPLTPDYLGARAPSSFKGQPALPVTGAAPAAGVAAGPQATATGGPGATLPTLQRSSGIPAAGGADLTWQQVLNLALKGGSKLGDVASILFGAGPNTAIDTPSGQLTTSAPEILRGQQFPEVPDVPGGTFASEGTGALPPGAMDGVGLGDVVGPGANSLLAVANLVRALISGDPASIFQSGLGLTTAAIPAIEGTIAGVESGSVGAGIAAGSAAAEAIAPWAMVAAPIIPELMNMLFGPSDHEMNARDIAWAATQDIPEWFGGVYEGARSLGRLNGEMSNEDLLAAYSAARLGVKSGSELAAPFASSGNTLHPGVNYPDTMSEVYPAFQTLFPANIVALLRAQDLAATRGLDLGTLDDTVSYPRGTPPGYQVPGEYQYVAPLHRLSPAEILGMFSDHAGIDAGTLGRGLDPSRVELVESGATFTGDEGNSQGKRFLPRWVAEGLGDPGYSFSPEIMQRLDALKPGGYEAGFRSLFADLAGDKWGGSPLAQFWTALDAQGRPQSGAEATGAPETFGGGSATNLALPGPARTLAVAGGEGDDEEIAG